MFPKIKKHIAVIVISGLLLFNFTPLLTPSANADLTGGSWATAAGTWAHFVKYVLKEFVLDLAARLIARSQLSGALKGIANQVIQSGRTGRTPAFVQNWRNLLTDAEYRGEDVFRAVLGNTVQCPYFRNEILGTFGVSRIPPIPGNTQNLRVNNLDPFTLRGRCTMPQAWSIDNYERNFSGNGGWDALVRLSQPQNNFYGSLLISMNELEAQRNLESKADLAEASPQGFTGVRKSKITGSSCDTPPTTKALCEECTKYAEGNKWCFTTSSCVNYSNTSCTYYTEYPAGCSAIPPTTVNSQARCTFLGNVSTPSKILGEGAAEFIDSNLKWLTTSDEISEVLGNFIQAMVNKLANYAADTIIGDAKDPKLDQYNTCIRQCNNLSSASQYGQCVDRCARQVPGHDIPPGYDGFGNGPTPTPPIPPGGGAVCGNGVCEAGESSASCPADCGGGGGGGGGGANCGNGSIDAGEQCDGTNLNGLSCSSFGFSGGTLSCSSCNFITTACTSGGGGGGGGGGGANTNVLFPGQSLRPGEAMRSLNGQYSFDLDTGGNLILYDTSTSPSTVLWTSGTSGNPAELYMDVGGNLILYFDGGSTVAWTTNTNGNAGAVLDLSNTGNLVIYSGIGGSPIYVIY